MSSRHLVRVGLWGATLGLLVALPVGGQQRVSVELGFMALALWLLTGLAITLVRAAPPHGGQTPGLLPALTNWLTRLRSGAEPDGSQLKDHRYIGALVMRATTNERSHARRLRPRLQTLVDYHLFLRHGLDRAANPTQAAAIQDQLFGDTAWLLDPAVIDRKPTLAELDQFLRRLNDDSDLI